MILRYRVSLPGIKGFARVYEVKSTMTLYEFHKLMRDDMDFPNDQLIQLKGLDVAGGLVARYGMFDLGAGTADEVTLAETVDKGITSFVYFYNVTERKSVTLTLESETEEVPGVKYPALVETKGPNPEAFENGYVAYEDLPDEQRHLPGESSGWNKDSQDAGAESDPAADDFSDVLGDDADAGSDEDDDDGGEDDEPRSLTDEDGDIIFDGSEDLSL